MVSRNKHRKLSLGRVFLAIALLCLIGSTLLPAGSVRLAINSTRSGEVPDSKTGRAPTKASAPASPSFTRNRDGATDYQPPSPNLSGIPVGDFSVSASPSSRTVSQGGTATYTITVQSFSSFNSAVSLTALNLPGNQVLPGTGFSPQTVTPPANGSTTSTLNIVTNSATPTGTFTITVQGQGGGLTRSTTITLTVNSPDFTVSASPSSKTITQGGTASYTITVQSFNGFNSGVSLTALNLPGNQVLPGTGFSPQTVTPPSNSSTTSTFSFVSNTSTPTGTFTITIQGQGGGLTRSTTVSLTVNPVAAPDFTVSASPSSRTIAQGGTATYTVTVQSFNGFNSAVSLTALNLPGNQVLPGTGFSPQTLTPPANGSTSATFSFVSNTSTPTGTFTITVQGQGGGLTRSTTVSLTVTPPPDFTVSASPSSNTIIQGGTATYTITVQSFNGFNSAVSLTALNLPGNQVLPGTGFSPQTVTPPANSSTTSTFSFVSNTSTPTGTFTITVQGQGGGLTRATTVSLTINPAAPPDFSVSASPSSRTIAQGGTATYTVTVQSANGFNSAVSLTALNLPGNQVLPGTGFSPQTITPPANGSTTSTFSFVSNTSTPTGNFTITVQGQSGGLTRSTTVSLTVTPPPDFTVSASPSSNTITQGGTASYTITVQSLNGFNSGVSLTALNLPGNQVLPGTGFSPQTVTPPSNSSTTSTFSFVSNTSTPTGTFTITVQGQSGGLARTTTVSLTVNPAPVPDFSISAAPGSRTISQGGTTTYTITVTSANGFNGTVSLAALNLPGNVVLAGTGFSPQTVTVASGGSASSTFTYVSNSTVPTGTFTLTMQGSGGGLIRSTTVSLTVTPGPAPDFTISATPTFANVARGGSAVYSITVQSQNGFSNGINLTALNLPGNQVLPGTGFSPQTAAPPVNGSTTSTLTIVTDSQTLTGTFTITVRGQGGGLTRETTISLTVTPAPDFSIVASTSSASVTQGGSASYIINLQSVSGFTGSVGLFALSLPNNQVLPGTGFSPQTINLTSNGSATSTLTLTTSTSMPSGIYTITVEGRSGGLTRSTALSLTINPSPNQDFTISSNLSSNAVTQGEKATYTIVTQSISGFSGVVSLFAIGLPNDQVLPGTGFTPQTVTPQPDGTATSTLTIATDSTSPTGTFSIVVQGRCNGITRSTTISLKIEPPQPTFTIAVSPNARTINQGSSATFSVTVRSVNGFNAPVGLFVVNLPNNQTLAGTGFSPQTVTPSANGSSASVLTIASNNATPLGTFDNLRIEARSGGLTKTFPISLTINQPVATAEMQVIGVEVTQGLQDLRNDIELNEDKTTFVRVYVKSLTGNNIEHVTAQLTGTRIDQAGNVPLGTITPSNRAGELRVLPSPNRQFLRDSFFFELPRSPNNWTRGTIELDFRGVNHSFEPCDRCKVRITFHPSPVLPIRFVGIIWRDSLFGAKHVPTWDHMLQVADEIVATYPVARLDGEYIDNIEPLISTGPPGRIDMSRFQLMLLTKRTLEGSNKFYMGVLIDPPSNQDIFGVDSLTTPSVMVGFWDDDRTFPHELGHGMGRKHTKYTGEESNPGFHDPADGTISPNHDPYGEDTIWGFDTRRNKLEPIEPSRPDVMSYGPAPWPSAYTYSKLREYVIGHFGSSANAQVKAKENGAYVLDVGQPTVVVSGSVGGEAGAITSMYKIDAPTSTSLPNVGSYALRMETNQGQEITTLNFEPDIQTDPSTALFSQILPWSTAASRVVLLHNGQVLNTRSASANTPSVSLTFPTGGESLSGANATLRWTASDGDGDPLNYVIQYSPNGGTTWQTLASDWTLPTYELDLSSLSGTNSALVRILASDGFYTAQTQSSATFSINKHTPIASIQSPTDSALFVGDQAMTLNGSGYDPDDGMLNDSAMTWSSNRDGFLGGGSSLSVEARTLSEGIHLISLTVRDSDGQTSNATVSVQISRTAPSAPNSLSLAPTNLSFATGSGNGQTQELLSVRNNGDGALNWSATADQSWIHFGLPSGNTPSDIIVSADATGLAVGTYTGHITVASPTAPNSPQVVPVTFSVAGAFLSGRVVDGTGNGLGGVTLTLNGPQTIALQTSSNGNYSFGSLSAGINYTLVPTKTNYTFSPASQTLSGLSGNQVANFTARINEGVPILVSEPDSTRALAFDPILHVGQPFPLNYSYPWGVDRRSRVMLFATWTF
jgi:hypothetical protein